MKNQKDKKNASIGQKEGLLINGKYKRLLTIKKASYIMSSLILWSTEGLKITKNTKIDARLNNLPSRKKNISNEFNKSV